MQVREAALISRPRSVSSPVALMPCFGPTIIELLKGYRASSVTQQAGTSLGVVTQGNGVLAARRSVVPTPRWM